jgi:hypothetical protein
MEDKAYSVGEMTKDIPYLTVEGIQARNERVIHRLIRIIIILIIGLILNNAMWIYFYNQYDYSDTTTTDTVTVDSNDGGNANYIGNDGEITNGENNSDTNNPNENPNTPDR